MKYKVQNTRVLTGDELLSILCKSAKLYSEIMFILQKSDGETTYNKLFYEIKKGLFQIEKEDFLIELQSLITV